MLLYESSRNIYKWFSMSPVISIENIFMTLTLLHDLKLILMGEGENIRNVDMGKNIYQFKK